jgi:hypothetical protein
LRGRHHWHIFLSRWRAAGDTGKELLELAVGWFREPLRAAGLGAVGAGSGGCSSTCHGRLGAGVTISIDAVPAVFRAGLLAQHPICYHLFYQGRGVQGNSHDRNRGAAAAARRAQAVEKVYERFKTACDDLDSGLFDLDQPHCYCCMQFFGGAVGRERFYKGGHVWCRVCSYHVHGSRDGRGGQHHEFADPRPNDRCSAGCSGCTA